MTRLGTLPNYFKEAQSPKILDSAFPPFKTEHRYRGVYERAGFDVNLNGLGKGQDGKSIRSKVLPTQRHFKKEATVGSNSQPSSKHTSNGQSSQSSSSNSSERRPGFRSQTSLPSQNYQKPYLPTRQHSSNPNLSPTKRQPGQPYQQSQQSHSQREILNAYQHQLQSQLQSEVLDPYQTQTIHHVQQDPYQTQTINHVQQDPHQTQPPPRLQSHEDAYQLIDQPLRYEQGQLNQNGTNDSSMSTFGYQSSVVDPYAMPTSKSIPGSQSVGHSVNLSISQLNQSQHSLHPSIQQSIPSNPSNPSNQSSSSYSQSHKQQKSSVSDMYGDNFDFSPQPNFYNNNLDSVVHDNHNLHIHNDARDDSISYSPSTSSKKNVKNLSLKLKNSNISNADDIDTNSVHSPTNNIFQEENHQHATSSSSSVPQYYDSTQETSINRSDTPDLTCAVVEDAPPSHLPNTEVKQDVPYPINRDESLIRKNKRLSHSFDDFKRDVEDVKKYTPPTKNEARFQQQDQLDVGGGNGDYQQFLNSDPNQHHQRHSQLSMVSSILSKDSINDEDAEIERELERQLQSLKTGDQIKREEEAAAAAAAAAVAAASAVPSTTMPQIPIFNIQEEGEYERTTKVQFISPTSEDNFYPHQEEEIEEEEEEEEKVNEVESEEPLETPERSPERNQAPEKEIEIDEAPERSPHRINSIPFDPRRRQRKEPYREEEPANESPVSVSAASGTDDSYESVQALSINHSYSHSTTIDAPSEDFAPLVPRNHSIEEELKTLKLPSSTDSINDNGVVPLSPPGKGPCRSCFKNILSNATGTQKAIFSKTGELSGQWHRSCFTCSYEGCSIRFKKGIQCYALYDKPFCHQHYHELNGTLCEKCSDGIEGECIENELGQKWHLRCLTCYQCNKGIQEDYYLINGEVFCENDALNRIKQDKDQLRTDKIEKRRTRLMFVD